MSLAATWKESIIGNKELVIRLTRTFHLSLSQRHSCLILWVAVAQQMCRVSIGKWVLLVLFSLFFLSFTVSIEVRAEGVEALGSLSAECSGVVQAVFFSCWQQPGFPAGNVSGGKAPQQCVGQAPAPATDTLQGRWNHPWWTLQGCVWKGRTGEAGMLVWRGSCLSGCACSNPALFPLNSSAKTCW